MRNFRDKRIIRIRICKHRANRKEDYKSVRFLWFLIVWRREYLWRWWVQGTIDRGEYQDRYFRCCWYLDDKCVLWSLPTKRGSVFCLKEEERQEEGIAKGWIVYLWWFEGIVCGKMNREEENTTGIWTIALKTQSVYISLTKWKRDKYRSHDRGLPVKL